jgi:hypothetical protein
MGVSRGVRTLTGGADLNGDQLRTLGIAYHAAFDMLRRTGDEDSFHTLAAAMNIAARFCEMKIGDQYSDEVQAAIDALKRTLARGKDTGRWGLDGDGLKAVELGLYIHDKQMEVASVGNLRAAMNEVWRRNELMKEAA